MKVYIYVKCNNDLEKPYEDEHFDIIRNYPELVQYNESYQFYWCDIKFIRKLKLSTIENSNKYNDIIGVLFNKKLVEFLEHAPQFGTSGTTGSSGTSGTSGSSGTDGAQYKGPEITITEVDLSVSEGLDEDLKLLKELIDGTLNLGIPKEYFNV